MGVSENRDPEMLITRTPKYGTLIFGKSPNGLSKGYSALCISKPQTIAVGYLLVMLSLKY